MTETDTARRNRDLVRTWMELLLSGRQEQGLRELWALDATVTVPVSLPYGGIHTLTGLGAYAQAVATEWELDDLEPPRLYADGDRVFAAVRWNAVARATGVRVDQPLLEEFTVRDGRITGDTLYFADVTELVAALGAGARVEGARA